MALLEQLHLHFGAANVQLIAGRDDLYCCNNTDHAGRIYQIIYIDLSDAWLKPELGTYFEDILTQCYYTSEAYLQWNFYYYFVADLSDIDTFKDEKAIVENDEAFARKFILTEDQLIAKFSTTRKIGRLGGNLDGSDLYTEWMNFLRENELHFVYDEANYPNYKTGVERFLDGFQFVSPTEQISTSGSNVAPHITSIKKLEIDQFRSLPTIRSFEFGKVNLISGPNATGKTSFFDTLEYCLTGEAKGTDGENYLLKLTTSDNHEIAYPDAFSTYRQRDVSWYKSVNTRGHNLSNNFNKFNYFSSDAAFILKSEDDRGKNLIERTITDIAIGRELNRLEERVTEFRQRFDVRLDEFSRTRDKLIDELEKLAADSVEIQGSNLDDSTYKAVVVQLINTNGWAIQLEEDEEFIAALARTIELATKAYEDLLNNLPPSRLITAEELDIEIVVLTSKIDAATKLNKDLDTAKRLHEQLKRDSDKLIQISDYASVLRRYLEEPNIEALLTINEDIRKAEKSIDLFEKANVCLTPLRLLLKAQPPEVGHFTFINYGELLFNQRQKAIANLETATVRATAVQYSIDNLSRLISDIKRLGREYIEAVPNSNECPLCESTLSHRDLVDRVKETITQLGIANSYQLAQQEVRRCEQDIEDARNNIAEFDRFEEAIPSDYLTKASDLILNDLVLFLENEVAKIPSAREALIHLKAMRQHFEEAGFNLSQFRQLKYQLIGFTNFEIENLTDLDNAIKLLNNQKEDLDSRLIDKLNLINDLNQQTSEIFDGINHNPETLDLNLRRWGMAKAALSTIAKIKKIKRNDQLTNIHNDISELSSAFSVYKDHWYRQKLRNEALELMTRTRRNIEDKQRSNTVKLNRVIDVLAKLDFLLKERGKMQYLAAFVNRNRQEIVEIFSQIHSPTEFHDINFEQNKIKLKDNAGNWHTINEVSTGQRTAVALSLFLSLNKKLDNGPDVILMDDPVTYVDDLNTLSFFDYLRELVEQSNRQLFFATANADVSFLFAKKFDYLGSEVFKKFEFKRAELIN